MDHVVLNNCVNDLQFTKSSYHFKNIPITLIGGSSFIVTTLSSSTSECEVKMIVRVMIIYDYI